MNENLLARFARMIAAAGALATPLLTPSAALATVVEEDRVAVSPVDGTKIVYTLFLPDAASPDDPVPAVMLAHGFGAPRNMRIYLSLREHLVDRGYAVMTWDARGFGKSGGVVQMNNPAYEGRDAQKLIDVLAGDPRIAQEQLGDPRVGMAGGSYGGGIQYVTAALDDRIDAIAPEVAWHSAAWGLIPEGVVETYLTKSIYLTSIPGALGLDPANPGAHPSNPAGPMEAVAGNYDPLIHRWAVESAAGDWSQPVREFFAASGPFHLLDRVRVPVFILQATVDQVFGPSHGAANFVGLRRANRSVPLKMMWHCVEFHGPCKPSVVTDRAYEVARIGQWMDRHVRGDRTVDTGPTFEYATQEGRFHGAHRFPPPTRPVISDSREGDVAVPGAPVLGPRANTGPPGTVPKETVEGARPSPAAFEVPLPAVEGTLIGQPVVRMTATAPPSDDPIALFFLLVDKQRNHVLGNQVTPKAIIADGKPHTYEFPIEGISFTTTSADRLALQIAGSGNHWETSRFVGSVHVENVSVEVPVRVDDPPSERPRLKVRPQQVRAGRPARLRFRATAGRRPLIGALIRLGSRSVRTDAGGRASIARRFRRPGRYEALLRLPGLPPARVAIRVLPARD